MAAFGGVMIVVDEGFDVFDMSFAPRFTLRRLVRSELFFSPVIAVTERFRIQGRISERLTIAGPDIRGTSQHSQTRDPQFRDGANARA